MASKAPWAKIARKTRRNVLLAGTPRVKRTHKGIALRRGPQDIGLGLLLFAFGLFFPAFAWFLGSLGGLVLMSVIGLAMCAGGALLLLHCPRVSCEDGTREIVIRYGFVAFTKEVRVAAESVEAELALGGHVVLWLAMPSDTKRVRVARCRSREQLSPAFEALSGFLGGEMKDETLTSVEIRDGRTIRVAQSRLTRAGVSFKDVALLFPTQDVAVLRPISFMRLIPFGFLILGMAALAGGVLLALSQTDLLTKIAVLVIGAAHTTAGVSMLSWGERTRKIVFDRVRNRVTIDRSAFDRSSGRTDVAAGDIAGIQICSGIVESGGSLARSSAPVQDYTTYEMNVVLAEPEGKRVFVMSHAVEATVRADAARLSEFLGTRVLDHTR